MKKLASSGGIQSLLTKCIAQEARDDAPTQYSKRDLKSAERKFLKYVLEQRRIGSQKAFGAAQL